MNNTTQPTVVRILVIGPGICGEIEETEISVSGEGNADHLFRAFRAILVAADFSPDLTDDLYPPDGLGGFECHEQSCRNSFLDELEDERE